MGRHPAKCAHCAGRQYGAAVGLVTVAGVATGRLLLRRHVAAIHAVSRFVETIVRRDLLDGDHGWDPVVERIDDVVPPPTGAPLDSDQLALLDRLPTEPFILFVGQLSPHKGVAVLLRAYASLRDEHPDSVPPLVLIGTPVAGARLDIPEGVTLLESVPHAVVMAAWERSLFGVAPSVWPDPLPGVVREPMTRGRPVIATRVGGNTDMVNDGVNGLLVAPGRCPGARRRHVAPARRSGAARADGRRCDGVGHRPDRAGDRGAVREPVRVGAAFCRRRGAMSAPRWPAVP